jgi:hypothetical protein
MPYQLILSEMLDEKARDIGENVFFENLPSDYEIYVLYYPSAVSNEELEGALRDLGNITGKNLFVNVGKLNDPNYKKLVNKFQIKELPVIIITAIDKLASPPNDFVTAYIRIDDKKVLSSPDKVVQCIERLFNLFIGGEISEAIKQFEKDRRNEFISRLGKLMVQALKGLWEFLEDLNISISIAEGKFQLKHSGG